MQIVTRLQQRSAAFRPTPNRMMENIFQQVKVSSNLYGWIKQAAVAVCVRDYFIYVTSEILFL